jgi:hypothetical protein
VVHADYGIIELGKQVVDACLVFEKVVYRKEIVEEPEFEDMIILEFPSFDEARTAETCVTNNPSLAKPASTKQHV